MAGGERERERKRKRERKRESMRVYTNYVLESVTL